jgi:hypothetical protein
MNRVLSWAFVTACVVCLTVIYVVAWTLVAAVNRIWRICS